MFTKSAQFYDAMYSFKDYAKEAEQLHDILTRHLKSGGNDLLDVACGTGKHLLEFEKWFSVYGVDLDAQLLQVASSRIPDARLFDEDMRTFNLGFQVDVVTCLFSSIGYMTTLSGVQLALKNMANHLKPGGVLLVEPWLYKDQYQSPHLHMLTIDQEDFKLARISQGNRHDDVSVIDFEYLIVTQDEVIRESERHELGLYTQSDYEQAIKDAGLEVEYDPIGPMGRGLFIGVKPI